VLYAWAGLDCNLPMYASHIAGVTSVSCHTSYLLRWSLLNFLPSWPPTAILPNSAFWCTNMHYGKEACNCLSKSSSAIRIRECRTVFHSRITGVSHHAWPKALFFLNTHRNNNSISFLCFHISDKRWYQSVKIMSYPCVPFFQHSITPPPGLVLLDAAICFPKEHTHL
jgi:hypothetical protein